MYQNAIGGHLRRSGPAEERSADPLAGLRGEGQRWKGQEGRKWTRKGRKGEEKKRKGKIEPIPIHCEILRMLAIMHAVH